MIVRMSKQNKQQQKPQGGVKAFTVNTDVVDDGVDVKTKQKQQQKQQQQQKHKVESKHSLLTPMLYMTALMSKQNK